MTKPTPEPAPSHDDIIDRITEQMINQPRLIADLSRAVAQAATIVLALAELDALPDADT
ncbi:hypothetical protein OVA21_03680 [Dietzia sp. SL131]|uniref:hypothetical protein n=1 Tax=Dietzia sp. SL131 TaxID=2995149 RepID=UPI00227C0A93|nr:hypothetical protein [Dietzia sp. SL131]MCY1656323.1 hypothetical protein [Dietzia sp. SL131]